MPNRIAWIVAAGLVGAPAWAQPDPAPPSEAQPPPQAPSAPAPTEPAQTPPPPAETAKPAPPPAPEPAPAPSEKPAPEVPPAPPLAARPPAELPPTLSEPPKDEAAAEPAPLGEPRELGVELGLAVNDRLGSATNYAEDRSVGVGYGVGFWANLASRAAAGLELSFADLGRASAANGQNLIDTEFSSAGLWLGGRLFPWQSASVRVFVALRLGLVLQHVAATGARQSGSALTPATSFDCSGWGGPQLGLGAGVGGVVRLNSRLDVIPQLGFRDERLTSNEVDGCASGVGSSASFSAGFAVAYGFDGPKGSGP